MNNYEDMKANVESISMLLEGGYTEEVEYTEDIDDDGIKTCPECTGCNTCEQYKFTW